MKAIREEISSVSAMRCLVAMLAVALSGCSRAPEITRFHARPAAPTVAIQSGEHPLRLGLLRDGLLYVPKTVASRSSLPLFVMLHFGGGRARDMRFTFPVADALGVAVLAPDARDNTWDGIDNRIGPDVRFIDEALRYTFERVAVDPKRVAFAGTSDGASYALSLGLANGDLFTHLVAFSPGSIFTAAPPIGRPLIFMSHGTRDHTLPIGLTSRRLVPRLRGAGYDVTYLEFDGGHAVPIPVLRNALEWLVR